MVRMRRSRPRTRAVNAAVDAQLALQREPWPETGPLRVRMGLHTGSAEVRDGDYFGTEVNRAARLMAVADGGQVLCSQSTADLARGALGASCSLVDLGEQQLRDLQTPEHVFQVVHSDLPVGFPVLRTLDAFPGNLPLQVTEFVGRDDELVELAEALGTVAGGDPHRHRRGGEDEVGGAGRRGGGAALPRRNLVRRPRGGR